MATKLAAILTGFIVIISMVFLSIQPEVSRHCIAAYTTGLSGRTPNQRYNARRAAKLINGAVIAPGQVFSFNQKVGGWSASMGYRKAPVSYNGVLVDECGGGVCQTSTTVYNAALIAGLTIIERHAHTFAPGYVAPGRDAAVAYENVDLRFRNPYTFPIVLHALIENDHLVCGFTAAHVPVGRSVVETKVLDTFRPPTALPQPGAGHHRARWHLNGRDGVRVAVFRQSFDANGNLLRSELISDNKYRGINAAVWAAGPQ